MTARRHDPSAEITIREAAPFPAPPAPAVVVPLPTGLNPKQRHQQAASYRHGEDPRSFKARLPGLVAHLHALGVRPTAELLIEHVGASEQAQNDLLLLLEKYARLSPAIVEAVGGDRFPPAVFSVGST